MINETVKLKGLLNSIPDSVLCEMDLWVNNNDRVEIIATDETSITLITDKSKVKINDMEW